MSPEFRMGYEYGMSKMAEFIGMSEEQKDTERVIDDVMCKDASFQHGLCTVTKYVLEKAGAAHGYLWNIYDTIEKSAGAVSDFTFESYLQPALEALSSAPIIHAFEKSATSRGPASIFGKTFGALKNMSSDAYKNILLASALLGAGSGGAYWALKRSSEDDDVEVQLQKDQADYYRRLAGDIKRRVKLKEMESPHLSEAKGSIEDDEDPSYIL